MSRVRDLVFPDDPRCILEGVEGWLLKHFPRQALVIGGGTVLASIWSHRVTTDCDLFTDERAFREVDFEALRREVRARLRTMPFPFDRLWRRAVHNPLFTAALGLSEPWYVKGLNFDEAEKRLTIRVDFRRGSRFAHGDGLHPVHDTQLKRYCCRSV